MANVITIANIRTYAPEFTTTPDATLQVYADMATMLVNFTWLDARAVAAGSYLAAHLAKMEGLGTSTTIKAPMFGVASMTVGEDSISFTQPSSTSPIDESNLNRTTYGAKYLMLINIIPMTVF